MLIFIFRGTYTPGWEPLVHCVVYRKNKMLGCCSLHWDAFTPLCGW